jgi:hypothetical protein
VERIQGFATDRYQAFPQVRAGESAPSTRCGSDSSIQNAERLSGLRPSRTKPSPLQPRGTYSQAMCNLYSVTTNQAAIIALARAMRDITGNMPSYPGVFPDYMASWA